MIPFSFKVGSFSIFFKSLKIFLHSASSQRRFKMNKNIITIDPPTLTWITELKSRLWIKTFIIIILLRCDNYTIPYNFNRNSKYHKIAFVIFNGIALYPDCYLSSSPNIIVNDDYDDYFICEPFYGDRYLLSLLWIVVKIIKVNEIKIFYVYTET